MKSMKCPKCGSATQTRTPNKGKEEIRCTNYNCSLSKCFRNTDAFARFHKTPSKKGYKKCLIC